MSTQTQRQRKKERKKASAGGMTNREKLCQKKKNKQSIYPHQQLLLNLEEQVRYIYGHVFLEELLNKPVHPSLDNNPTYFFLKKRLTLRCTRREEKIDTCPTCFQ